ncbi:hypothetical protein NQ117_15190 [Paenibacillus sp. SC116]|nr:hypothetical protein [Paenibacillus sp. SC116]
MPLVSAGNQHRSNLAIYFTEINVQPEERNISMIAYGCIAILIVYAAVISIRAYVQRKRVPTAEEVDEVLLTILNRGRDTK